MDYFDLRPSARTCLEAARQLAEAEWERQERRRARWMVAGYIAAIAGAFGLYLLLGWIL